MILQLASGTSGAVIDTVARIVGTAVFAGFLAAAVALLYRWYVRERVPLGLGMLVGLAGVAVVAGTTSLLAQEITPTGDAIGALAALLNVVTFVVGGLGAYAGMRFGDALGVDLFAATGGDALEGEVSDIVKAVGRVITVEIPDEIDDIVGYDPVPEATKEKLAGRTFVFPRRLTRAELRERFVSRLKTDYGVGHVDVEFDERGAIDYLALGTRAAGIGPTLPPATNAVAIRADPANAASAGDLVQVWRTDPMQRVLTGELRGVAGETVTIAIDAADTPKLDPTERYKLVTLPVQDRPDREFASLLRAADETLATVTVEPGSAAAGTAVGALGVTVAAITREDEPPVPLPDGDRRLEAGDVLYAIATPDALRRIEAAAEGQGDPTGVPASGRQEAAGDDGDADDGAAPDQDHVAAPDQDDAAETDPDDTETTDSGGPQANPGAAPAGESADDDQSDDEAAETGPTNDDRNGAVATASSDDDSVPSGGAFPDSDDLPGIDPDEAMGADDGDTDDGIPEGAAFPDADDLPGGDVDADVTVGGEDDAGTAPSDEVTEESEDETGASEDEADASDDEADTSDDEADTTDDSEDDETTGDDDGSDDATADFADLIDDSGDEDDDLDDLFEDDGDADDDLDALLEDDGDADEGLDDLLDPDDEDEERDG